MKRKLLYITVVCLIIVVGYLLGVVKPRVGTGLFDDELLRYKDSKQFYVEKMRFANGVSDIVDIEGEKIDLWKVAREFFFNDKQTNPTEKFPEIKPNLEAFSNYEGALKFIWLGHSSFLLNFKGQMILVDPVFSEAVTPSYYFSRRFQSGPISLEDLPVIDYIVISHDHYDHLDADTVAFFKESKTKFLVPLGISSYLISWGIKKKQIVEFDWWDVKSFDDQLDFIFTPSQHFSGRLYPNQNNSLWGSWIIKGRDFKLFYSGDTGYSDHFKEIGKRYGPFDISFMENGQFGEQWSTVHMHPHETVRAFKDIMSKRLVPVHWGMFNLSLHSWYDPPEELYKLTLNTDIDLITPKLGEVVDLSEDREFERWWRAFMPREVREK